MPMVQEHSNVDLNNPEFISTAVCSTSLNVWLPFNPIQSTLTEELPRLAYQLHQQASASVTLLDITHCTPSIAKIKVHNSWATAQWISYWSTVLLLHLQMQHQFTKLKPLLIKLCLTLPKAIAHTKKVTFLGTLVHHTLFHGNLA